MHVRGPSARRRVALLLALSIVSVLPVFGHSVARARESGFNATPAGDRALVSKDVNGERWALSYDRPSGVVTGNVFPTDGGAPRFVV